MKTKILLISSSTLALALPLGLTISCNTQQQTSQLAKPLKPIDRNSSVLSTFDFVSDAAKFLMETKNNVVALEGKRFISDNAKTLFDNSNLKIIDLNAIEEFRAQENPVKKSELQVSFLLNHDIVNPDQASQLAENQPEKPANKVAYTFNIGGFSVQETEINLKTYVNQINLNYQAGKYYLINPKVSSTKPLADDLTFDTISANPSDLIPFIGGFHKLDGFRYQIKDFKKENRTLQFKFLVSDWNQTMETELLTFYSPSRIFDNFVATTPLTAPNQNVKINDDKKAIALSEKDIDISKQKTAITKYLEKQWFKTNNGQKTISFKDGIYYFSLSRNTNSYFNKVFGLNWSDVFSTSVRDFNNVTQIIVAFKLNEKNRNTTKDEIATFEFVPEYLQFSWDAAAKPAWLTNGNNSHRFSLADFKDINKVEVSVKNNENGATKGDLVNIK